jgi:uncharacterized protein (DUF2235 family)
MISHYFTRRIVPFCSPDGITEMGFQIPRPLDKNDTETKCDSKTDCFLGDGLSDNISDASKFLIMNYEPREIAFL